DQFRADLRERRNDLFTVAASLGFISLVMFYPMFRSQRRVVMRYAGRTKNWLKARYQKRWVGLFDSDDEAINGIAAALQLNGVIVPAKSFVGLVKLIPVVFLLGVYTVVLFLSLFQLDMLLTWKGSMGSENLLSKYVELMLRAASPFAQTGEDGAAIVSPQVAVASIAFAFALLTAPLVVVYGLFDLLGRAVSPFIANSFDGFFWKQVKDRAFGNDTVGETVGRVTVSPFEFEKEWSPLPERLNDALQDYTSQHAASTVRKARDVLGLAREQEGVNIVKTISDQLSWGELIHTAYFDVPGFIDLVAYSLIETGDFRASADFKRAEGFEQAKADYAAIRA
ncbi:MAG: hypothetical protein AAFV51_12335, partial [Pseudomonadota bacterium]